MREPVERPADGDPLLLELQRDGHRYQAERHRQVPHEGGAPGVGLTVEPRPHPQHGGECDGGEGDGQQADGRVAEVWR